jgi:hypothetical protein
MLKSALESMEDVELVRNSRFFSHKARHFNITKLLGSELATIHWNPKGQATGHQRSDRL